MTAARIVTDAAHRRFEDTGHGFRPLDPDPDPDPHVTATATADLFNPLALDWEHLQQEGLPTIEYLDEPYLPAGARVWAHGAAGSAKSLFGMVKTGELTRAGLRVVFLSQENPLPEDARRLERIRPDWSNLVYFHDQGFDLTVPYHVDVLVRESEGAALVVLDTLTACWSGDENDNAAIGAFDRDVLARIVRDTGASVLVLDHVGHPQAFVSRRGVHAGRGASAKGQKADVVLEFRSVSGVEFTITHAKNRFGGVRVPDAAFRVVDRPDGSLAIESLEGAGDAEVRELADYMVSIISGADFVTTKQLRAACKGRAGKSLQSEAMSVLLRETPPRVAVGFEVVETDGGRQRAKVWRVSQGYPEGVPHTPGEDLGKGVPEDQGVYVVPPGTGHPSPPPSAQVVQGVPGHPGNGQLSPQEVVDLFVTGFNAIEEDA